MSKELKYNIISAVALDLGGKNTGVLLTQGKASDAPHNHQRRGVTLIYPEKGLNLSQKDRLAKRHQRRGFKRRRLSKRLLQLILSQLWQGKKEDFLTNFQKLRTFLNRRGYTYLTLEEVEELQEEIQSYDIDIRLAIVEVLGKDCGLKPQANLLPQLEKTDQKPLDFYRNLVNLCDKAKENKTTDKSLKKVISNIKFYCERILKSEEEGHKPRSEYLALIDEDLQHPDFKDFLKNINLQSRQLANLIGHIANLQLRVLRRYFNDPKMSEKDYWDEKRLEKVFLRYLRAWHVKHTDREYQNRKQLFENVQKNGLLKTFLETNPELSIPPFEDMNNRRPPACKSLHIDETKLDQEYPGWRQWVKDLLKATENTYELENYSKDTELSYIVDYYKKSQPAVSHKKTKGIEAVLLQRLLDRTADLDRYRFRLQVNIRAAISAGEVFDPKVKNAYDAGETELKKVLGLAAAGKILEIAERYYREVDNAKRGLWLPEEKNNILYRCDRKPKQKKNLREELIGHILVTDFRANGKWSAWEQLYRESKKINNRSSIASVCRNIEETRKDLGDEFTFYWNKIQSRNYIPDKNDQIEKEVLKHKENAEKVASVIAEFFGHDAKKRSKYANPYSLAQVYNIMEGDISGFYRTCPACTRENFWRTAPAAVAAERRDGSVPSRAVRLPADTMRPFDGFLARYLDRIGDKVAMLKWRELENLNPSENILVPILLEQNRFSFNRDLAEIKKAKTRKAALEKWKRSELRFEDKYERIRKAGKGICPYTGEPVSKGGEFDHILPRSYSKGSLGTVFNSEMNLIYASSTGNRKKGDKFYTLKDLHPNYLSKVYGTKDVTQIIEQIQKTLNKYDSSRNVYFHNLSEKEQRDFRHALFEKSLHHKVKNLLHSHFKMRVSGLQGYLARVIYEKLLKLNENKKLNLHFQVFAYDAKDDILASRRQNLAAYNPLLSKPVELSQAPGSHVIDSTMVWAHALEREDIPGLPKGLLLEDEALEELLPDNLQVISLAAREKYRRKRPQTMQIFKDTIYAERYLSLILGKNKCGFGYDLKNMVEFDYEKLNFVFELLKPFIVYKSAAITEPLDKYQTEITTKKKYVYFNIVREKAAEFLQKNAYAPALDQTDQNRMNLLTGLRYFTLKNNIFSAMGDQQGKAVHPFQKKGKDGEEGKDSNKFTTKLNIKLQIPDKAKTFSITGTVALPQLAAWKMLLADKTVKTILKKSGKWNELSPEETTELIRRHFPQTIVNPRKHHGVRKVYSLPIPEGPSGGFRIQRKRRDSARQFHVQAIEGAKFSGFAVRNGKVDFKAPAIMPLLTKQDSLASTDGYIGPMPDEFVYMDEWREISLTKFPQEWKSVKHLWLQPNSESRMRVRLELDNAAIGAVSPLSHLVAPLAISTKIKNEKGTERGGNKRKKENNLNTILTSLKLQPRDKINLVKADQKTTTYEFVVQSTNSEMQEWYNSGKPCDI